MAAPFVPQDALQKLRTVARAKGLRVWVDHEARITGKAFLLLQKEGRTLAEFDSHKPALQWLGVQARPPPSIAHCWRCGAPPLPAGFARGPPMTTPKGKAPAPTKTQGAHGEQLSFLPPPPFCPTWPKRGTLADRALGMLMDGRLIDHPEFEDSTQSWRLGAVIFTLRALGWPVETIEVPSPTEHSPDRVIALYRLDGKYTAQALAMNGGAA